MLFWLKVPRSKKEGYGKQKLFSSLGWGVSAFLYGWIVDAFGLYAIFYSSYIFCTMCIIIVLSMDYVGSKYDKTNAEAGISESSDARRVTLQKLQKKSKSIACTSKYIYIAKTTWHIFFATQFLYLVL